MLSYYDKEIGCEEGYYYCIYEEEKVSIVTKTWANRVEKDGRGYQYRRAVDTGGMSPEQYDALMEMFEHEETYETNKLAKNKRLKEGKPILIMPDKIAGRKVTGVVQGAFKNDKVLKKISLSKDVLEVGQEAFKGCEQLHDMGLNDQLKRINKQAFMGCGSLREIDLPDQLEYIEEEAFKDCRALAKMKIPMSVKSIGEGAFEGTPFEDEACWENGALYIGYWLIKVRENYEGAFSVREKTIGIACGAFKGCQSLTSVSMPESVCYIGAESLSDCKALKKVKLPSYVVYMARDAVNHCECLEEINLPEGLIELSDFKKCQALKKIKLPSTVTKLWQDAFSECSCLSDIELSINLKDIGENTFRETAYWQHKENWREHMLCLGDWLIAIEKGIADVVTVPEGIKGIADGVFYRDRWYKDDEKEWCYQMKWVPHKVREILLPESLRYIGKATFEGCRYLEKINIPKGVKWLKMFTFSSCIRLKRLRLPSGVERIERSAIENCDQLEQLIIENPQIRMEDYSVAYCNKLCIHALSDSTVSEYARKYQIRLVEYEG